MYRDKKHILTNVVVLFYLFLLSRVSVTFHLMCVHTIFSSVSVAEWPPVGKELLTRLTICSLLYFDYL